MANDHLHGTGGFIYNPTCWKLALIICITKLHGSLVCSKKLASSSWYATFTSRWMVSWQTWPFLKIYSLCRQQNIYLSVWSTGLTYSIQVHYGWWSSQSGTLSCSDVSFWDQDNSHNQCPSCLCHLVLSKAAHRAGWPQGSGVLLRVRLHPQ